MARSVGLVYNFLLGKSRNAEIAVTLYISENMINAKREAKIRDRAFQRTIQALVHDYDRCSPVNTKIKKQILKEI